MSNSDASRFDAYYKWLGIPKRQQPPNHYRILAVKLFETDAAVIQSAAERQAAFINDCSREKHQELGQKLIAEIAAARECLLNPETRAAYDEELKKQQDDSPTRPLKQSRYDVQVAHGANFEVPEVALPATAPVPLAPPELVELKDDSPPARRTAREQPGEPSHVEPIAASPSKASRTAQAKAAAAAASAPISAPLPQVASASSPAAGASSDTVKIIKLVLVACVLAGGVTIGALAWLSRKGNSESSQASFAQPVKPTATTAPMRAAAATPAASTKPASLANAPGATQPVAAASAAPKAAAPAPRPAQPVAATPVAAPASRPVQPLAAAPRPEPRSEYWPKLANAVVIVSSQQPGPPSVLNINEDGTFDSPNFGAGRWRLVGRVLSLEGKAGTVRFTYDPGRDVLAGERGNGSIVARRPLTNAIPQGPGTTPPAGPAGQAPPTAAAPPPAAKESGWVYPMRTVAAFRRAWVRGDAQGTVDFDEGTDTVMIESGEELGGFAMRSPWKEISLTLYAETITGQLEIQVNKTVLKFNTATALIRKPAIVVVKYDPATFKLTANVGSRQVASATVLEENFTSQLTCRFRAEGAKTTTRIRISEVKVFVP